MTILYLASLLVPGPERSEWSREWRSELWYVRQSQGPAFRFCLGAFRDALWMRRNCRREKAAFLQSPRRTVFLLLFLAALSTSLAFCLPGSREALRSEPFLIYLGWLGIALLLVPTTTSVSLGEYPPLPGHAMRPGRWFFLAIKIACILPIVFFGMLDLAQVLSAGPPQVPIMFHGQGALIGYIAAFRWVIKDQRRRCPVCLRLLTNPTRIGQPSQLLLDWYGSELMCEQGHGLLYVPGTEGSFSAQRWLNLDSSWRSLFP